MHQVHVCANRDEVSDLINGARTTKAHNKPLPLGGLTLIFSNPARTVTFGVTGETFTAQQVAAEIHDAHSDFDTFNITSPAVPNGQAGMARTRIQNDSGFTIDKDGTANALLGFSTTEDTVSEGMLTWGSFMVEQGNFDGHYLVIIDGTPAP